jgi:hypothetical protein
VGHRRGQSADLRAQRHKHRLHVGDHVRRIHELDTHGRHEYLQTNAEAILFDANALLSSLEAWTGYQSLHAARASVAGPEDAGEAGLVDVIDLEPYLRILRWLLEDGETLRVLAFPDQLDALGPMGAVLGVAKEKLAAARDKAAAKTLVAVTDRRIITAKTNAFLEQGEIGQDIPTDRVRYVRATTTQDESKRLAIDLITRDENIRWLIHADTDNTQVDALAAVLAESMTIPDVERDEFQRRRYAPNRRAGSAKHWHEVYGTDWIRGHDLRCRVGLEPI